MRSKIFADRFTQAVLEEHVLIVGQQVTDIRAERPAISGRQQPQQFLRRERDADVRAGMNDCVVRIHFGKSILGIGFIVMQFRPEKNLGPSRPHWSDRWVDTTTQDPNRIRVQWKPAVL